MAVIPQHGAAVLRGQPVRGTRPGAPHRLDLSKATRALARTVAEPAADAGWRGRVDTRLEALGAAARSHVALTEGPGGPYADLLDAAPRLARQVARLMVEHGLLVAAVNLLRSRLGTLPPEEIRGWTGELLRILARHRRRGGELIHEAYATDLGGET